MHTHTDEMRQVQLGLFSRLSWNSSCDFLFFFLQIFKCTLDVFKRKKRQFPLWSVEVRFVHVGFLKPAGVLWDVKRKTTIRIPSSWTNQPSSTSSVTSLRMMRRTLTACSNRAVTGNFPGGLSSNGSCCPLVSGWNRKKKFYGNVSIRNHYSTSRGFRVIQELLKPTVVISG